MLKLEEGGIMEDCEGGIIVVLVGVGLLHPPRVTPVTLVCYGISMNLLVGYPKILVSYEFNFGMLWYLYKFIGWFPKTFGFI